MASNDEDPHYKHPQPLQREKPPDQASEHLYMEMDKVHDDKKPETADNTRTAKECLSPSDKLDSISDISMESLEITKDDDHTHLCSELTFYGPLNTDSNISPELKEQLGPIRKFVRKVTRLLKRPSLSGISNTEQQKTVQSDLKEIYQTIIAMDPPSETLFEGIKTSTDRQTVRNLLKKDIKILARYGEDKMKQCRELLIEFDKAKANVENAKYKTRQTTKILEKGANIPPHYFNKPEKSNIDNPEPREYHPHPMWGKEGTNDLNDQRDLMVRPQATTPNLPWEISSRSQENLSLELTLKRDEILNCINNIVPENTGNNLDNAIIMLNQRLEPLGIQLDLQDPEFETKLKHLESNRDTLNLNPNTSSLDTYNRHGQFSNSMFFTPMETIEEHGEPQTKFFTPCSEKRSQDETNRTPKYSAKNILPKRILLPMDSLSHKLEQTSLEDLERFQRNLDYPSVRGKHTGSAYKGISINNQYKENDITNKVTMTTKEMPGFRPQPESQMDVSDWRNPYPYADLSSYHVDRLNRISGSSIGYTDTISPYKSRPERFNPYSQYPETTITQEQTFPHNLIPTHQSKITMQQKQYNERINDMGTQTQKSEGYQSRKGIEAFVNHPYYSDQLESATKDQIRGMPPYQPRNEVNKPHESSRTRKLPDSFRPNESLEQSVINKIKKLKIELDIVLDSHEEAERLIRKLNMINTLDFHEMQDLLVKLPGYAKTAKQHRKTQVEFHKSFVDIENQLSYYDHDLYLTMQNANQAAATSARELSRGISFAEEKVTNEKITNSNISAHDSKEIIYWDFNGGNAYADKNIFEVLANHESNHKLTRTNRELKGLILKKHLKGAAKLYIPQDVEDYGIIKEMLIRRFGNETDLLSNLYALHHKIGPTPPKTGTDVDWVKINDVCKSHLTLLRRADAVISKSKMSEYLVNERYVTDIAKYLSQEDRYSILHYIKSDPRAAFNMMIDKFSMTLNMSQEMIRTSVPVNKHRRQTEQIQGSSEWGLVASYEIITAKDCEVCQILQSEGDFGRFFENHIINKISKKTHNSACPLYLGMHMEERVKFAKEHNFCLFCMNLPKPDHSIDKCRARNLQFNYGKKKPFTCTRTDCPNRLELCTTHKYENGPALAIRQESLKKHNIEMCLLSFGPVNSYEEDDNLYQGSLYQTSQQRVMEWVHASDFIQYPYISDPKCEQATEVSNPQRLTSTDMEIACISNKIPLMADHENELLDNPKISGIIESNTQPVFMFMKIEGHTRGLNLIFDSGASASLITTNAIPGQELKACKSQHNVQLQGLGASKRQAQSWKVLLPLSDGTLVATQAYSVPHILGPLTPVNLLPALTMLKKEAKDNEEVQQSQIYEFLGGNIDILAGIRLNALFPEIIYQMSNGLALYRLKLASFDKSKKYCLGGPYEVVNEMKSIFQESVNFFNEIEIGLKRWHQGFTAHLARQPQLHRKNNPELIGIVMDEDLLCDEDLEKMFESLNGNEDPEDASLDSMTHNHTETVCCTNHAKIPEVLGKKPPQMISESDASQPSGNQPLNKMNAFIAIKLQDNRVKNKIKDVQKRIMQSNKERQLNVHHDQLLINIIELENDNTDTLRKIFLEIMEKIRLKQFNVMLHSKVKQTRNKQTAYLQIDDNAKRILLDIQAQLVSKLSKKNVRTNRIRAPQLAILKATSGYQIPSIGFKKQAEDKILGLETVCSIQLLSFKKHYISKTHKIIARFELIPTQNLCILPDVELEAIMTTMPIEAEINKPNNITVLKESDISCTPFVASQNKKQTSPRTKNNKNDPKEAKEASLLKNLEFIIDAPKVNYRCFDCLSCTNCKTSLTQESMTMKEHLENYLIEKSVKIDREKKHFVATLPLTHDEDEMLTGNKGEAKNRLKRVLHKLEKNPKDKEKIKTAFNKLRELGYIVKLADLDKDTVNYIQNRKVSYYIPWDYVSKPTSVTTEKRQVYDASSKTKTGHSLNDILSKGCPKMDLEPMIMNFVVEKYGLSGDLEKFYQSIHLDKKHYHLQLMLWSDSMNPEDEPSVFVITRITFGLKSSSQQLEHCVHLLANENKDKPLLYRLLTKQRYVDDLMGSYKTIAQIESLKETTDKTLAQYGMFVKGYCQSYSKPSLRISDGNTVVTGGYVWECEKDLLYIRIQPLHYTKKFRGEIMTDNLFIEGTYEELNAFVPNQLTTRQVASRGAQIFDPLGWVTPWKTGIKTLTRESMNSVNRQWDEPLSDELRERWIQKFWQMQLLKEVGFPRSTIPLEKETKNLELICFCDAGKLAKVQTLYLLHKTNHKNWHVQLLYSKSQLIKPNKTLPNMELDSLNTGAEMLNKCLQALPNVKRMCLAGDSLITSFWVAKDTISLATYQRIRVSNIRRLINLKDIFHCKGEANIADIATKKEEPLDSILPGSNFQQGPNWLTKGIELATQTGYLSPILDITIHPGNELWNKASDGLVGKCNWPEELLIGDTENSDAYPILSVNEKWVNTVKERYPHSDYLIDPLKKTWPSVIRSTSIAFFFIHRILQTKVKRTEQNGTTKATNRWVKIYLNIFNLKKRDEYKAVHGPLGSLITTESKPNHETKSIEDESDQQIHITKDHLFYIDQPRSLTQTLKTLAKHIDMRVEANDTNNAHTPENNLYEKEEVKSGGKSWFLVKDPNRNEEENDPSYQREPIWEPGVDVNMKGDSLEGGFINFTSRKKKAKNDLGKEKSEYPSIPVLTIGHKTILQIFKNGMTANFFKSLSILYYMEKASNELLTFYHSSMLKKHCFKIGNTLFSKNRWLESHQLKELTDGDTQLLDFNIQACAPAMDRHSPVAISLAMHFHHSISKHAGVDRSYLLSQGAVFIFQGRQLFEEICRDCLFCRRKLRQKYNQLMGPMAEEQLTYSAVGRFLFLDMSGPYWTKKTINARTTRNTNALQKTWLLHGVCVVSNYSVVQVLEAYDTDSFVQAVHRIASYIGYPQLVLIDSSQTEIKGVTKTKFSMYDASNQLYEKTGISMKVCGVGPQSHAKHGIIERRVGLFKRYFELVQARIANLTPIGLYTLALQAATYLNAMPLATKKRNGTTISSRLVTPACFFLGRQTNNRAPCGIPEILDDHSKMLDQLQKAAEKMKEYYLVNVPDLLLRTCWQKDPKFDIKLGDLVLFTKRETTMSNDWKLGVIDDLEKDSDNIARIAHIRYFNAEEISLPLTKEDKTTPKAVVHLTRRSSHTIARIHSIDEPGLQNNLAFLNQLLKESAPPAINPTEWGNYKVDNTPNKESNEDSEDMLQKEHHNIDPDPIPRDISRIYFVPQLAYLLENNKN